MKSSFRMMGPLLLVLAAITGCEDGKTGPAASFVVSGSVDDAVQGEGRTAALIWVVSSGSPDYGYKFGEGTIGNGRFSITLPGDPPAEAINSFGVGVAMVLVPLPGVTWPDGKLVDANLGSQISGISARHSVIWRAKSLDLGDAGVREDVTWPLQFPAGLSCGTCTPAPDGGSFDGFAPFACDQLRIDVYGAVAVCNWT
jgi:hypothetical protein